VELVQVMTVQVVVELEVIVHQVMAQHLYKDLHYF